MKAALFKFVLMMCALFAGYNVLMNWRRQANYDTISFQESKENITAKLGVKVTDFSCATEELAAMDQVNAFCQQPDVFEVTQFQPCYIASLCPSVILVAFDKGGKMIYKFRQ